MRSDEGSQESPYAQQISALAQAVTELARTVSALASLPDQSNTYSPDEIASVDAAREGLVALNQRVKALLQGRSGG